MNSKPIIYINYFKELSQVRNQLQVYSSGSPRYTWDKSFNICYKRSKKSTLSCKFSGTNTSDKTEAKNKRNTKQLDNETETKCLINSLEIFNNEPFKVLFFQGRLITGPIYKDLETCGSEILIKTLCSMIIFLSKQAVISTKCGF